jgi:glycosyltransferase involved in cell wall biosynthesis
MNVGQRAEHGTGTKLKVVHLCESDGGGGAALAAFRLHSALKFQQVDSTMLVGRKVSADENVASVVSPLRKKLHERLDRLPRTLLRTSNPTHISPAWIGSSAWRQATQADPDLVHLHWICKGFVGIEQLQKIRAPLLWSLHDMWAIAGGEHYVGDCTRYRDGYAPANRPAFERGFDLNRWIWLRKRHAWSSIPHLTLLPVSAWLAERARESALFRNRPIEVLHNALDAAVFRPGDRVAARNELGLPPAKPLVLFGAVDGTKDARKGFDLLTAALRTLRSDGQQLELVVFGNGPAQSQPELSFRTHYLGEIHDPVRLVSVYRACDAMVVPSREEAFGQTAMEALACGTPVAAFRVGGLPEIVAHKASGYLAKPFDVGDLAAGILWLLDAMGTPAGAELAGTARRTIEEGFTLEVQARRCRKIYETALETARQGEPASPR